MKKKDFKINTPTESYFTTVEPEPANNENLEETLKELEKDLPRYHTIVKEPKNTRLNLLLRASVKRDLKIIAERNKTSVNNLINDICEEYIIKHI